jgi:polysaccharide biosynthesis transport protein
VQKLAELQAAATGAAAVTIEKEAQYRQLQTLEQSGQAADTHPAVASNGYVQGLKGELTALQNQLAQASQELGDLHPEIIRLKGAVQNAESRLKTEVSKVTASIRNDYEVARTRERSLVAALERQKMEVQGLNALGVEYTALEREATSNRELLDNLLQRSRQISLARDLPTVNARILDAATVPDTPILPRTQRNLLLALFGSVALAFGLVFLLELFNTRVNSPDDVRRHLGLRVLGVTPQVDVQSGQGPLLLDNGAPPAFVELFHGVRTNLVLAPELAATRTLLVTSAEPGEGKTTAAANMAVSLARLNQRVLLIDADLRRPRLHEVFGIAQQPGLTDILTAPVSTPNQGIHQTSARGLWLLPSGTVPGNPTDLIGSERFTRLIQDLQAQFDWVVLDSPPVLAVSDSPLLARVASGVLFVVGCRQTSRDVASAAMDRLTGAGATVVGAMLNRIEINEDDPSYLPYYHRASQSYYPKENGVALLPEAAHPQAAAVVDTDRVEPPSAPAERLDDDGARRFAATLKGRSVRALRQASPGSDVSNPWNVG